MWGGITSKPGLNIVSRSTWYQQVLVLSDLYNSDDIIRVLFILSGCLMLPSSEMTIIIFRHKYNSILPFCTTNKRTKKNSLVKAGNQQPTNQPTNNQKQQPKATNEMSSFIPAGTLQPFEEDENQHEIELYDSSQERRLYDNFADLYAIIMTTESLERAYARNAVSRDEVCV